jgi:hypothetical protein
MKNKKKLVLFLAISALIVLGLQAWDDEKLFTTIKGGKGKSNVILIQDRTGSMYSPIYHPDFNPKVAISNVTTTNAAYPGGIINTLWYVRWLYTTGTTTITTFVNNSTIYAQVHEPSGNTLKTSAEGAFIRVGDTIVQYNPSAPADRAGQAVGKVTAVSGPDSNLQFTLTLNSTTEPRQGNFVVHYNLYVWAQNSANSAIYSWDNTAKKLVVLSDGANVSVGDYIMQFNSSNPADTTRQAVGRVALKSGPSSSRYTLTLDNIQGTFASTSGNRIYYRRTSTTNAVCLYGTNIDQGVVGGSYDSVGYDSNYLNWIFVKANDAQRKQISALSTLGHDIDYNAYLRPTPVSPLNAYALNMDNTDNTNQTLLQEWNSVMKAIYPNSIANMQNDPVTATATTINYYGAKDSFKNYSASTAAPFYIKIDAETMKVIGHTPSTDPLKPDEGQLTVVREQNNTSAATHPYGSAIMIYNDTTLGIDESTPETSLFSSMQHVTEATGDVDPTWTESKTFSLFGTNVTRPFCYRYKRIFSRIQVAREALCDVVTAKNKLLKIADLTPAIADTADEIYYCNANADFATRVAPFFIKVSDPANPANNEVMLVTEHHAGESKLKVSRGQQGTYPCSHDNYAAISTYSGARDLVRFGIFTFSTQAADSPAKLIVGLNDFGQKNTDGTYKPASYLNTVILDQVATLRANLNTPLARALAYVWNYLKPNPGTGVAGYIDTSSTGWKAVDQNTFASPVSTNAFETIGTATHVSPRGSPMEYWCQENYAVLITDGESTDESGFTSYGVFSQTSLKTPTAAGIISDFYKFDYNNAVNGPSRWGDATADGSEYLTDVAYFLAHQDMFPTMRIKTGIWDSTNYIYSSGTAEADTKLYNETDTDPYKQWPGNQNIKTYTVGLSVANAVLPKAAKNGGGASFTASNYRDLSGAFLNIITSVALAQDPMSYTTYAAPKQSITEGKYGYIAHFIPRERAMWEGHLRRYRLGDDGSFPANIDNPADTVSVGGVGVTSFQWDAGVILNTRTTERVVYTSKPSGSVWPSTPLDFMGSSIGVTDLDVSTTAQLTQVKEFIQNFNKADGINANSDYNTLYRLGETFHFNPQLVGYPLYWKAQFDPSYKSFYERYSSGGTARAEVVYTGANDGKLHCFQSSTAGGILGGTELWSYVPFALLKQLKKPALNPLVTTSHNYFVDGKSLVKDIKVGNSGTYTDWKTGLFFGLGIGGRAYCALDITNPNYLKVLWETQDSAETVATGHMGFTEAKPVQVDMFGGSTLLNFPGMILAGGYNAAEVQATDMSAQEWQRREGKALYILNADTGALVKKFVYGASASSSGNLNQEPDFLTAMTAAPAVLDSNNDGKADVIYFAESGDYRVGNDHGGAIWKINCYGDPATWQAQKIYQAPAGQTIFVSPSLAYDTDFRVWVMFGTGRRFTNLTGQFVAFIDDNIGTAITNANLHNAATAISSSTATEFTIDNSGLVKKGFYFNFLLPNEIMFEPQPLYVNQKVYFMTFTPREGVGSTGATDDPCGGDSAVNGSHYIYQFKLTSQANTFIIGDFLNQSGKILGYGPIDDKFTIYVGAGDAGNFKSIEGDRINDELKSNYNSLLWKEDKK